MGIREFIRSIENNPVYLREFYFSKRKNAAKPPGFGVKLFWGITSILYLLCLVVLFHLNVKFHIYTQYKDEVLFLLLFIILFIGLLLIYKLVFIGSFLIREDKDRQIYPMLIATAMKPSEIIEGKFWITFHPIVRELALYFTIFAFAGILGMQAWNLLPFSLFVAAVLVIVFRAAAYISLWASAAASSLIKAREIAQGNVMMNIFIVGLICLFIFLLVITRLVDAIGFEQINYFFYLDNQMIITIFTSIVGLYFLGIGTLYKNLLYKNMSSVPEE